MSILPSNRPYEGPCKYKTSAYPSLMSFWSANCTFNAKSCVGSILRPIRWSSGMSIYNSASRAQGRNHIQSFRDGRRGEGLTWAKHVFLYLRFPIAKLVWPKKNTIHKNKKSITWQGIIFVVRSDIIYQMFVMLGGSGWSSGRMKQLAASERLLNTCFAGDICPHLLFSFLSDHR